MRSKYSLFIQIVVYLLCSELVNAKINPLPFNKSIVSHEHLKEFDVHCILSDIDGTLVDHKSTVSSRTKSSIQTIKSLKIPFFIATGRSRKSMSLVTGSDFIKVFGGDVTKISGVFSQGLEVYGSNGELIFEQFVHQAVVEKVDAFSKKYNLGLIALTGDRILCDEYSKQILKLPEYDEPLPELYPNGIVHLFSKDQVKINKLILMDEEEKLRGIRGNLEVLLANEASVTHSVDGMLEILPYGASKGRGVEILLEHYNLPASNTIAFGDGENDIEMLSLVGLGIAVENAKEKLKAVADVLTHSNNNEGVAHVLDIIIDKHNRLARNSDPVNDDNTDMNSGSVGDADNRIHVIGSTHNDVVTTADL